MKQAKISKLHDNRSDEAMRYFLDFGYYMVDCPHCNEVNDTEIDSSQGGCVTCNKTFKTGLIAC